MNTGKTIALTKWTFVSKVMSLLFSEASLVAQTVKLKLQYFGHLMRKTCSSEKTLMMRKIEGGRRRG